MQRTNNDIWISFGPDDQNTLRAATACDGGGDAVAFRIEDEHLPRFDVTAGLDVLVFFNGPDGFMQQSALIVAVSDGPADGPVDGQAEGQDENRAVHAFGFELYGEAVSAENREMFRVGVSLADYTATVDGQERKLADVSVLGFAFFADTLYSIGDMVEISIVVNDEPFSGRCRVQSVKETGVGHRYGVLFVEGGQGGTLEAGLRKLTMDAQRTQLRRLSRAG